MNYAPAFASFAFAAACLSCGSGDDATDAGSSNSRVNCLGLPTACIATEGSFDGFHNWSTAPAAAPSGASDGLHVGPLRVYWNESPPHGATEFPVGTMIVKESQEADVTRRTVFAMVKRGASFNETGAVGWDWFSLANQTDGSVTLLWSGTPLKSDPYSGQVIGDCNGCHKVAGNDSVWDTALELSKF